MNTRINAKVSAIVVLLISISYPVFSQIDQLISQSDANYVLFEAEDYSDRHAATDGNSQWTVTAEGIISAGVAASSGLMSAKAIYKLSLLSGGNYTLYVRYKTEAENEDASLYVSSQAGSPFGIGKFETTGTIDYKWFNVVQIGGFSTDKEQSLTLFPDIAGVTIDQILLHKDGALDVEMIDEMGLTPSSSQQFSQPGLFAYGPLEDAVGTKELVKNNQGSVMNNPSSGQRYFPFNGNSYYTLNGAEGTLTLTLPDIGCISSISTGEVKVCFWWFAPDYASFSSDVSYSLNVTKRGGMGGSTVESAPGVISNTTITSNGYRYNKVEISSKSMDLTGGQFISSKIFIEINGTNAGDLIWIDNVSVFLADNGAVNPYAPPVINSIDITTSENSPQVDFIANTSVNPTDLETFEWDFGDGTVVSTESNIISHTYSSFGDFTVTVTAFDNDDVSPAKPCDEVRITASASADVSIAEAVFLPVELLYFQAEPQETAILLSWATATELNNDHFVVENSSNGIHFEPLGQIDGAGNSQNPRTYSFQHENPANGWNYYRLKQVDFDGSSSYSDVVSVNWQAGHTRLSVFPNPTDDHIQIVGLAGPARVIILDIQGKIIQRTASDKSGKVKVDQLEKGVYVVRVFDASAGAPQNIRFVKK